jgi:hypothetical protein
MNDNKKNRVGRSVLAIGVWENEGGAHAPDSMDCHYGRRIESDRSWTVYHVFTGVPARIDGRSMTGLSRREATDNMLSINQSNVARRTQRSRLRLVSSPMEVRPS